MAQHTYVIGTVTGNAVANDVYISVTGTADSLPFSVSFYQSQVLGFTVPQLEAFLKALVDPQVFPAPALVGFQGKSFTL